MEDKEKEVKNEDKEVEDEELLLVLLSMSLWKAAMCLERDLIVMNLRQMVHWVLLLSCKNNESTVFYPKI